VELHCAQAGAAKEELPSRAMDLPAPESVLKGKHLEKVPVATHNRRQQRFIQELEFDCSGERTLDTTATFQKQGTQLSRGRKGMEAGEKTLSKLPKDSQSLYAVIAA